MVNLCPCGQERFTRVKKPKALVGCWLKFLDPGPCCEVAKCEVDRDVPDEAEGACVMVQWGMEEARGPYAQVYLSPFG